MIFILPTNNQAVHIRKSKRAKRYLLSYNRENQAELIIPYYHTYKAACQFISHNETKICKLFLSLKKRSRRTQAIDWHTQYQTPLSSIQIRQGDKSVIGSSKHSNAWSILLPGTIVIDSAEAQKSLQIEINKILYQEARTYLPARLSELASMHNLSYSGMSIRNNKTVWGSCTPTNKINLNQQLMRLPANLIDYILLHELAHTKEKNHGKGFWTYLSLLDPNAKKNAKDLRAYSPCL